MQKVGRCLTVPLLRFHCQRREAKPEFERNTIGPTFRKIGGANGQCNALMIANMMANGTGKHQGNLFETSSGELSRKKRSRACVAGLWHRAPCLAWELMEGTEVSKGKALKKSKPRAC